MIAAAVKLNIVNSIHNIMAFTGSLKGNMTTTGSSGSLNRLCIKNTANEYLDNILTCL